jgi:hypothetical protein
MNRGSFRETAVFGPCFCICVTSKAAAEITRGYTGRTCQRELNRRSKPKKRAVREKPESLGSIIYNSYVSYLAKDEVIANLAIG